MTEASENLGLRPNHVFSYSQISSYTQCPHGFFLKYILNMPDSQNAYSQSGTLAHEIFEKWAKQGTKPIEMSSEWLDRYDKEVTVPFPPYPAGYREKLKAIVGEYMSTFGGFGDQYEVVAVECRYRTTIGGCEYQGIIDLLLKNKETGGYIVVDHKSKSVAALKKDKEAYRQLYSYAKFVKEYYGVYPEELWFHLFKADGLIAKESFSMEKYNEVIQWIEDSVALISMEGTWEAHYDKFFCQNLCGVAKFCETALSQP